MRFIGFGAVALALFASLFSDFNFRSQIRLTSDRADARESILNLIPLGTPLTEAGKRMEKDRFSCQYMQDSGFTEAEEAKRLAEHEAIDYLYCSKTKNWMVACSVQWDIALKDEESQVNDVYVSYQTFCL